MGAESEAASRRRPGVADRRDRSEAPEARLAIRASGAGWLHRLRRPAAPLGNADELRTLLQTVHGGHVLVTPRIGCDHLGRMVEEFVVAGQSGFQELVFDELRLEHIMAGDELAAHVLVLSQVAELDGLGRLVSPEQLRVGQGFPVCPSEHAPYNPA